MAKDCRVVILSEASLGRVMQHIKGKKNVKSWGVVTAYRWDNTPTQNREANKELGKKIRL